MTNGIPKPPPGFQIVDPGNVPAPPPGFRRVPQNYAPDPGFGGQEFVSPPESTAANLLMSATEGATFGFSDEIAAAIASLVKEGLSYDQALQVVRERMARIPTGQRVAGNIVGGIATAPALGLRAPGSVAQAAQQGGSLGALAGAGFAEGGPTERLAGAGVGAALGALLAAGGQALLSAAGRAIARARQGVTGPTAKAMDRILQELEAGEITLQQATNRVERLGPEGVLADVPELQRLAQQTAARTTTGNRIAESAMQVRRAGAGDRVNRALDVALGGRNTREVRNAIRQSRAEEARNLYDAALEGDPLALTDDLAKLIGGDGQKGSTLVRGQMESIRRSNPRFQGAPDTDRELLHATRVALADRGKLGTTPGQRNVIDVTQQLTDAMDEAGATGYRQAVNQYRSDSLTLKAFDEGRKALNALPEDIASFMKTAPAAEKDAFIAGLGREVLRQLETGETRAATTGVRNIFRGERAQVLREVLGPEEYSALRNRLLKEIRFAGTEQVALRGSQTEPRGQAGVEQFRRLGRAERAGEAIRGGRGMLGAVAEGIAAAQPTAPNVAQERALAQLLFRSQGQGLPSTRFAERSPLLELALRQRLLQGGSVPAARAAIPGAAGVGGGRGGSALLDLVGF